MRGPCPLCEGPGRTVAVGHRVSPQMARSPATPCGLPFPAGHPCQRGTCSERLPGGHTLSRAVLRLLAQAGPDLEGHMRGLSFLLFLLESSDVERLERFFDSEDEDFEILSL